VTYGASPCAITSNSLSALHSAERIFFIHSLIHNLKDDEKETE
jgi:hypothetical protein